MSLRPLGAFSNVILSGAMLLAFAAEAFPAVAQEAPAPASREEWGYWVSAGIGPSAPHDFGSAATASVRHRRVLLRVRYASSGEFLGSFTEDVGVLAGFVLTSPTARGQAAVGAGIGRVSGATGCLLCGSTEAPSRAGFLLDLEGRYPLTSFLGLSGYGFVDFNARESFGGIALGVYVGRI